jgi:putative peptidoglycan lipid II flippase
MLVKALTPSFFAREDTRTPLYAAMVSILVNVALNALFVFGTSLAQAGIALASSLSGWLNAALLGAILVRRGQLVADERLLSRAVRTAGATLGMGVVLWFALGPLTRPLDHADVMGALALLGLCVLGGLAYAAFGAMLGVINLSELRFLLRREPGVRPIDPGEPQ